MPKDIQTLSADTGYGSGNFIADVLDRGIIPHIPLRADEKIEPIPTWKNKTNSAHIQAERDRKVREAKARNHARSISLTADYKLSRRLRNAVNISLLKPGNNTVWDEPVTEDQPH